MVRSMSHQSTDTTCSSSRPRWCSSTTSGNPSSPPSGPSGPSEADSLISESNGARPALGHEERPVAGGLCRDALGRAPPHAGPHRVEPEARPGQVQERQPGPDGDVDPRVVPEEIRPCARRSTASPGRRRPPARGHRQWPPSPTRRRWRRRPPRRLPPPRRCGRRSRPRPEPRPPGGGGCGRRCGWPRSWGRPRRDQPCWRQPVPAPPR